VIESKDWSGLKDKIVQTFALVKALH
jgi:hypothetical protein